MKCDLCGKEEAIYDVLIEGTTLKLGAECTKFGKIISKIKTATIVEHKHESSSTVKKEEMIELIVKNYSSLVKNAREKKGIKQEEFAKKINEKTSLIHNVESGRTEPSINLARKLEKVLNIMLVENYENKKVFLPKQSDVHATIGSMVNIKHRKKD